MTSKVARKTVDFGHGIKVTVERPYTTQDAIDEFKREVEGAGGKVVQVHDELTVSGSVPDAVLAKATQNLTANLGVATTPLTEALRRYGKAVGLDPKFVDDTVDGKKPVQTPTGRLSFPHLERPVSPFPFGFPSFDFIVPIELFAYDEPGKKGVGARVAKPKPAPKPKLVKDVAPAALSTWEFESGFLKRMHGGKVNLVGQHYRTKLDQEVLSWKREGNMALLVAEPDNPVDINAVMVLVWNDQTKHWHHAGYVKAEQAAALRGKWTGDFKNAMVARITSIPRNPDGHRGGRNIELTLTGEVRTYRGYQL